MTCVADVAFSTIAVSGITTTQNQQQEIGYKYGNSKRDEESIAG